MRRLTTSDLATILSRHADLLAGAIGGQAAEFVDVEVVDADFCDLDLSGIFVQRSLFVSCRFIRCDLSDTQISDSRFSRVDFTGASLVKSEWFRCDARGCVFDAAAAGSATFLECRLGGASFVGADLYQSHFDVDDLDAVRFDPS